MQRVWGIWWCPDTSGWVGGRIVAIAFMLWRAPLSSARSQWGLSLVFGGALGNVWDRMFRGMVTDFLQFSFGSYEFPAFNAADSAITIGAGLLLIDLWKTRQATRSPAPLEK